MRIPFYLGCFYEDSLFLWAFYFVKQALWKLKHRNPNFNCLGCFRFRRYSAALGRGVWESNAVEQFHNITLKRTLYNNSFYHDYDTIRIL